MTRGTSLLDIVDTTVQIRTHMGDVFAPDVRERAVLAADDRGSADLLCDSIACEILRWKIPNHEWSGAIG